MKINKIRKKPFSYAPITIIEGDPRSGKTNTAVGRVVDAQKRDPTTKIFANFTLYGVKYVRTTLTQIVEYMNTELLKDGYIIVDEAYIGMDARESFALLTKLMTYLGMQSGKRRLYLMIISQHSRMVDWRMRWLATEHIYCTYNENSRKITLQIKKRGERKIKTITYYAPQYWLNYDTEEIVPIPETKLGKALIEAS